MSELTDKVDFNRIRYANCWEDADVLLRALKAPPGKNILCIASAGDNALALLTTSPEVIVCADLSLPQLHLTALKQAAIAQLDYEAVLMLLGVKHGTAQGRIDLYHRIAPQLSVDARNYWNVHLQVIRNGVIYAGKFERFFKIFRKWMLPLVHSRKTIARLLQPKPAAAQIEFYDKHWNTWRWKLLMNIFFSKKIMGKYGRDPEFMRHVTINVPDYIRRKTEDHLQLPIATRNYFLRFILTGNFSEALPFYLRRENFDLIKQNINKLQLTNADATKLMAEKPFDICCLSNIFEYISAADFEQLADRYAQYLSPGAQLTFWNLMAPRSFSAAKPAHFRTLTDGDALDMGFFYSRFLLEERL